MPYLVQHNSVMIVVCKCGGANIQNLMQIIGNVGRNGSFGGSILSTRWRDHCKGGTHAVGQGQFTFNQESKLAVGVIVGGNNFYEMLTGELPIGRFEVPSQKVHVDVRLDEVVLRTLEKEPQRRYQAASQIKSDLQSISSVPDSAFAPTTTHGIRETQEEGAEVSAPAISVEQQETAARLLLSCRELMDRVRGSLWLYRRVLNSSGDTDAKWQKHFIGESISKAYMTLGEIERAPIE